MTTFWWAVACASCFVVALALYWKRSVANAPVPSSLSERPEPELPSTYNKADEIEVVKEQDGSFQIRSTSGTVVSLTATVAAQVHRYLAPLKGCACSCAKDDSALVNPTQVVERDGQLFFQLQPNIPGYQVFVIEKDIVVLRDNRNATLALDKLAAVGLHVLLRPKSCHCVCSACVAVSVPGPRA